MGNRAVNTLFGAAVFFAFSASALGQGASGQKAIARTLDGKTDFSGVWLGASNAEVRARGLRTGQGEGGKGESSVPALGAQDVGVSQGPILGSRPQPKRIESADHAVLSTRLKLSHYKR